MRAYIFDKYGYYEDDEFATEFDFQGWHFKLEKIDKTEQELSDLNDYIKKLENLFYDSGVSIIKNRDGNFLSIADFGNCALVSVKDYSLNANDLLKMHTYFKNEEKDAKYTIKEMSKLWEDKLDLVEERILPSFKIDDYSYEKVMTTIIFSLGLAENALQYLAELSLDYGDNIENLTLAHKRFYEFSSYEFFSPFNLIVDSPMRDLAELYKSNLIDNTRLLQILTKYNPTPKEVGLLLARIIYPTPLFDLLDEYYVLKKDMKLKILEYKEKASKYLEAIKDLEKQLVQIYSIRPIKWMNE
ncbi:MAG: hypothetical protein J1F32_00465 [Erysipelotrichales bacterium]|nr:hypothetical protein [Erysipelotrichales bacterium]